MPAKKKSTVAKVAEAVQDAAVAVAHAADANVVQPVGQALGLTAKKAPAKKAAAKKAAAKTEPEPAPVPPPPAAAAAKKSAAARVLTKGVGAKKSAAAKTKAQPVTSAGKPAKVAAGASAKGPRRGASKGR